MAPYIATTGIHETDLHTSSNGKSNHPERFWVDYIIEASSTNDHARTLANEVCLEQTVELPGRILDVVKQVEAYTVGKVERIEPLLVGKNNYVLQHMSSISNITTSRNHYRVSIAYPNDTAGNELPQFLNVVFGNTSLKKSISVENVTLSHQLMMNTTMFPGPRFGIEGIRELLGVPSAPLLCTALKPMGRSSQEFANMAYSLAKGGIDIIKDDHGLSNQVWSPFEERVKLCSQAVLRANKETGRNSLYAPCLNAPANEIFKRAWYAKQSGAGAVMILPGLSGWDAVRTLAADSSFGLPILVHPAMLGGWLHSHSDNDGEDHPRGLSHQFLFGILPRLCGGDAVIFANAGGRFQFTNQECQEVAEGCRRPLGRFDPILPAPSGGMKVERVPEMRNTFGDDTLFLIGGDLLKQGPDLEEDARLFLNSAGRDVQVISDDEKDKSPLERDTIQDDTASSIEKVERVANAVRRRVLEYTLMNNGGYLSQACSSAETLAALYLKSLRLGPSVAASIPEPFRGSPGPGFDTVTGEGHNGDPKDPSLDRLILSPVHYALPLYSLLVEIGRLDIKAFESYNKDGSTVELIGAEHSPGHAVTAGSLGQALSQAGGIAYARVRKGHTGRVVVYMSDGEMQEGQTWEAVQALVFHKIPLIAVVDVNGQQCDGLMKDVCNIGSIANKLKAFGAVVREVDGHNVKDIDTALSQTAHNGPTFVLCYTDPTRGFPLLKTRAPKLHYVRFKDEHEKQQWKDVLASMPASQITSTDTNQEEVHSSFNVKPASVQGSTSNTPAPIPLQQCQVLSNAKTVVRPHRSQLLSWMEKHPKAIVLTADLTSSCEADLVRDKLPGQYLSMGMAEQNMMSFAGGLAREGFRPFIHTFGVFITRRPFDQVAMSIGVPNLPVRLLGFLPGLTTPGGVTHQAIDDIALMRSIPNMRILEVGDATEVESVLDVADAIDGPVYIRMLRGELPRLFPQQCPMEFGVPRLLSKSEDRDVVIITSGICTEEALKAKKMIQGSGVSILHLHLSTIIPFPVEHILKVCNMSKYGIITMENHLVTGGIGSATAEVLAEHTVAKPLIRLGVQNTYAHGASKEYLMREYGFDALALISAIEKLVQRKLINDCNVIKEDEDQDQDMNKKLNRPEDL